MPLYRVDEADVIMGEGFGGRGLPVAAAVGVCCAEVGYEGGLNGP